MLACAVPETGDRNMIDHPYAALMEDGATVTTDQSEFEKTMPVALDMPKTGEDLQVQSTPLKG